MNYWNARADSEQMAPATPQLHVQIPPALPNGEPRLSHAADPLQTAMEICRREDEAQETLAIRLRDIWNSEQAGYDALQNLLSQAGKSASISLLTATQDPSLYFLVGDAFDGVGQISAATTLYWERDGGYLTLPIESMESLNSNIAEIRILSESEGRPGDKAQIRSLRFGTQGEPIADVAADPRDTLESALDNQPETWFCWEQISVSRIQKLKRVGPLGALVKDSGGEEKDIVNETGGFGLTLQTLINGIGQLQKNLFSFFGGKIQAVKLPGQTVNVRVKGQPSILSARLVLEIRFTDPVPLSTIRVSVMQDDEIGPMYMDRLIAQGANGREIQTPGLPRTLTSTAGRQYSADRMKPVGADSLEGSGYFPIRPGEEGITLVRMELRGDAAALTYGAAHPFYAQIKETNEKAYILGVRTRNKTRRGQERIEGPTQTTEVREDSRKSLLTGPLQSLLTTATRYQKKDVKTPNSLSTQAQKAIDQQIDRLNINNKKIKSQDQTAAKGEIKDLANKAINQLSQSSVGKALQESQSAASTIARAVGGKVAAALGLGGPLGILAGAALTGNLYKTQKTEKIVDQGAGIDVFEGQRAALLLRELTFDSRVHSEQGDFYSETMTLPAPARAIQLLTEVRVPMDWENGNWLTAQVRPVYDEGESPWIGIWAIGSPWSDDPAPRVVAFDKPTQKVRVHIQLRRPANNISETPILLAYTIKGTA